MKLVMMLNVDLRNDSGVNFRAGARLVASGRRPKPRGDIMADLITKEKIIDLLTKNDSVVERAMVVLYDRQTASEQNNCTTIEHNGRGFSSSDASIGTYYAKWIISGKRLTGSHLARARKMAFKYTRQLLEAAEAKAARKAA